MRAMTKTTTRNPKKARPSKAEATLASESARAAMVAMSRRKKVILDADAEYQRLLQAVDEACAELMEADLAESRGNWDADKVDEED